MKLFKALILIDVKPSILGHHRPTNTHAWPNVALHIMKVTKMIDHGHGSTKLLKII